MSQILRFTLLQLSWVQVFTQAFMYKVLVMCMLRSSIYSLKKISIIYSVLQAELQKIMCDSPATHQDVYDL